MNVTDLTDRIFAALDDASSDHGRERIEAILAADRDLMVFRLAKCERRYAELAVAPEDQRQAVIARHANDMGLGAWQQKFSSQQPA